MENKNCCGRINVATEVDRSNKDKKYNIKPFNDLVILSSNFSCSKECWLSTLHANHPIDDHFFF